MCEVAELELSLVSYSNEAVGQLAPNEARCRDLARHRGDWALLTGRGVARHRGDRMLNFELCC